MFVSVLLCTLMGLSSFACKDKEEPETHGFVCVQLFPSSGVEEADLVGAQRVQITLNYGECLENFYQQTNPEYALANPEGQEIFTEWVDRLCAESDVTPLFSCEIAGIDSFTQELSEDPNVPSRMRIDYQLTDSSETVATRKFVWGPIPLEELAGCQPQVRLSAGANVRAFDANGEIIWSGTLPRADLAIAKTYSSGCIEVEVEPLQ